MPDDRIPCINPRCRRTAAASKYEPGEEIVCRTCFRALPQSVRNRYRALGRRERRVIRLIDKAIRTRLSLPPVEYLQGAMERARYANWRRMVEFFRPVERPAGIDAFLEEMQFDN